MRKHPIPLIILTGFLGSGKTTTLGHWLANTQVSLKRTAVIINDFGSVNVDAALLSRRQLELRSITGGCVCCQSFEDLVEQIQALASNPDLDMIWIETSGLADPEEVLDHLSSPELQDITIIRRLILVIDAIDFPCSWRGRAAQEEQIRYADLILLNKMDRIEDKRRLEVEASLRQINPAATIHFTQHGKIDPELLSGGDAQTVTSHVHLDDGHDENHHHSHDDCCHEHEHEHHHEAMPHAASTLFLPLNFPVDRAIFQNFLNSLPKSVFRAKGFVRLTDSPSHIHTFQQVRDQTELLLLPLETATDITTGLVFIGPHLEENRIRELAANLATTSVSV